MIGRSLIRSGEFLGVIEMGMEDDIPRLAPAASWSVTGGANPASWIYRVSLAGPSQQTARSIIFPPMAVDALSVYAADTRKRRMAWNRAHFSRQDWRADSRLRFHPR